jgi:hypothetical protein
LRRRPWRRIGEGDRARELGQDERAEAAADRVHLADQQVEADSSEPGSDDPSQSG